MQDKSLEKSVADLMDVVMASNGKNIVDLKTFMESIPVFATVEPALLSVFGIICGRLTTLGLSPENIGELATRVARVSE